MKRCSACGVTKPLDAFNRQRDRKDGRQSFCRECGNEKHRAYWRANRVKQLEKRRQGYATERVTARERAAATRHGGVIPTPGPCEICGRDDKRVVDHDHRCCQGKTSCARCRRGLLCERCNKGIGLLGDDPQRLRAAADYIERYYFEIGDSPQAALFE